ncbi:hypothetical protein ELD05_09135 [Caldicellulosiruptor changbaiensis]|uniref:Stage II sporulation protein M n=1 Tax=Caldicellulosiruptor changbaiensis TaxID=1222016 RepID=A0A3T0D6W8_9FIRM|nr:hypothetical protein [Caldicellulosiruptor changbaiensis]AZT90788.1 hypothetical protein ELD05_09135 [Caldicellulosiruptor changbaiensis]
MRKKVKLLFFAILTLYLGGVITGINFYFLLSQARRDELKNFIVLSINSAKTPDNLYWNKVIFFSISAILLYLTIWGLSNLNKYLQILNIGMIILKGFVFGLTIGAFFTIYKFHAIGFFFTYILLKELIVLIFLIILILYSFTNYLIRDRLFKFEKRFNIVVGLIVVLLICGIVVIDAFVSRFACNLI